MFDLPAPSPAIPSPTDRRTMPEIVAAFEADLRAVAAAGGGEINAPEDVTVRDLPHFWAAVAYELVGTRWRIELPPNNPRDADYGRVLVADPKSAPSDGLDQEALAAYLLTASDVHELRQTVRYVSIDAAADLPDGAVSLRGLVSAVVRLAAIGRLPGLRDRLIAERPRRRAEVEAIRGLL